MTDPKPAAYTFLPWVRQGLPAARLPRDEPGAQLAARVTLPVELRVNDDPVRVDVRLYGPGDVLGIDRRQVVRTEPRSGGRAFEPNYLAAIEFDRPDLPWLFTPASADAQGRLRPWLCLVVVRLQEGVALRSARSDLLPALSIAAPARPAAELPDLAEAWAWAHAQVAGSLAAGETLAKVMAEHPERTVSRLLCPRRLEPATAYLACVVPAFEVGRKAGLGLPLTDADEGRLEPAWRIEDPALTSLTLPVYYHWEFSTGASGDFESLVARLKARRLSARVGMRELDVSAADPALPRFPADSPDAILGLEGALMSPETRPKGFSEGGGRSFREALRRRLAPPAEGASDPLVAPPTYGNLHAGQPALPAEGAPPRWLSELNLDPRYRAVAAYGTAVVQEQQEELMAAAWEQVGEVERANQLLRQAQLVRAVDQSLHRNRLDRLEPGALLQVTRAVHARVQATPDATLRVAIASSNTPSTVVTAAFRRVARPRGPLARRALPASEQRVRPFVQRLAGGTLQMRIVRPPTGAITLDAVEGRSPSGARPAGITVAAAQMATLAVAQVPPRSAFQILPPELPGTPPPGTQLFISLPRDNPTARNFRAAAAAHQALIQPPPPRALAAPRQLQLEPLKATVLARLDPNVTVTGRVTRLVSFPGPRDQRDALEPIMAAPSFPQPMYAGLRDRSQELLLPGLDEVEDDTVALLQTNPRFLEAFMVGLNHELARELLWRGYPTDQRGSYFRQFWDVRGQSGGEDIPPLHTWGANKALGQSASGGGPEQLVLLLRGELLRRYPTAVVYAARAAQQSGQPALRRGAEERYPLFHGALDPDLRFFGFGLTAAEARGKGADPGWFFVIQQQPTEPRFGFDLGDPAGELPMLRPGANGAATALALLQRPVRIAIHARELLGPG